MQIEIVGCQNAGKRNVPRIDRGEGNPLSRTRALLYSAQPLDVATLAQLAGAGAQAIDGPQPEPEPEAVADTVVASLRLELDHAALVRKHIPND
eukprot:COSAG05_NODE_124_length_17559_cov_8.898643_6_plen_94_part_00